MDQTDLLLGKRETGREHFYFQGAGIRVGKWKYLKPASFFYGYAIEDGREKVDELYDLNVDIGERNNLASTHPQKMAELRELMMSVEGTDRLSPADNKR
jgi:arylsulfatase A-like enzyme